MGTVARRGDSEPMFASTTTAWRWVKVRAEPERPTSTAPKGAAQLVKESRARVARSLVRRKTAATLRYRGGAECWWEFEHGGRIVRVPGHLSVHDAMCRVVGVDPMALE